jgi:hypothetical protein
MRLISGACPMIVRLSTSRVRNSWRLKQHRHGPRPAPGAHESTIQTRQREVRPARPDQRLKVKLARVLTLAPGLHPFTFAPSAASGDPPASSEGIPEGFHEHENIKDGRWQYCRG